MHKCETHGLAILCENAYGSKWHRGRDTHTHTQMRGGTGYQYEWWWVASRDGSTMSVQCVLRVFKWVKSQLWLPDGGGLIWIILTGLDFDVLLPITDITWRQAYFSLITSNSSMPVQCMPCLTHQGYRGSASLRVYKWSCACACESVFAVL